MVLSSVRLHVCLCVCVSVCPFVTFLSPTILLAILELET